MIIALPVGLSLVNLINLWRLRSNFAAVDEATSGAAPADLASEVKAAVDQDPQLKNSPLIPLFREYKPSVAHWFEVMDMARRLILTCITVMLTDQASFFLVSLTTAILALAVHNIFQPMVDEGLDDLVEVGHWLLMLVLIILVSARGLRQVVCARTLLNLAMSRPLLSALPR